MITFTITLKNAFFTINTLNKLSYRILKRVLIVTRMIKSTICKRIKFNDEKYIIELLKNEKQNEFNTNFLLQALNCYLDQLKFDQDEIIINGLFSVDKNAQAYYLDNNIK